MENPNSALLSLELLPSDLWACIASFLPGEDIGRLKVTGAKILWQRLAYSKVVKAVIVRNVIQRLKSWPTFLNELSSVEELLIDLSIYTKTSEFSPRLSSVPSTLKKLTIFGNLVKMSNFFVDAEGNDLNLDQLVPHLEVLDLRSKRMESFGWMAHVPQSLTTLHLYSWASDEELPISLINFKVTYELIFRPPEGFQLPPHLERISAFSISGMKLLIPLLPPSFLQLDIYSIYGFPAAKCLPHFPKNMVSLGSISISISDATPSTIIQLPQSLTDLKVTTVLPSSCWHLLPAGLTKLSIVTSVSGCATSSRNVTCPHTGAVSIIPTYPVGLLPKFITLLSMRDDDELGAVYFDLDPPSISLPPQFPPHLTELTTRYQLSPNAVKHLPSSLTRLSIPTLCESVCNTLPAGLITLNAQAVLMSPNLVQSLPRTINFLHLRRATASDGWFDFNTGKQLLSIAELPQFTVHENCAPKIQWPDNSLPVNLIKLELTGFVEIGDEFTNQGISNLLELDLRDTTKITDAAIPLLGRHLSSLNLAHSRNVTGKCFPHLPKDLTFLDLSSSSDIFDSDIPHLPTDLITINFKSSIHLTNLCVKDLPRKAETIILKKNRQITISSLPCMPYMIRDYHRRCVVMTATWNLRLGTILED